MQRRTFLKGMAIGTVACAMGEPMSDASSSSSNTILKLPRARMEAVGIDPASFSAFIDAVEQKVGGLHSIMLLRHGQVAAEAWWAPYAPSYPHMLYSLSKSFTSTAVGLAVAEGHLSVDDMVIDFFPNKRPSTVSDNLAAMRVRHLLTMNTGHDKDATGAARAQPDGDWVRGFLSLPVEHAPGSKFVYNSAATYMLSAIVQKRTGKTVLEYLTPRLFVPLGIEHAAWEKCPKGINTGGWGLSVKTEDSARFGQLYLQKGEWNGRQIVPETWIAAATSRQVPNGDPALPSDWSQGYGYQFWRCQHGAYRGDGAFGQYCVVMPEQDAVLAITSGVGDMQAVLNAVWEHLLPGMKPAPLATTPENTSENKALSHKLAGLTIHTSQGMASSPMTERISDKTFHFAPSEQNSRKLQSLTLTFDNQKLGSEKHQHENLCHMIFVDGHGEHRIVCGGKEWVKGDAPIEGDLIGLSTKIVARGGWTQPDTYTATLCFYETPFIETITCTFAQDQVTVLRKKNVSFGPTEQPPLVGKLKS